MRFVVLGLVIAAGALGLSAPSASAQFNNRFCTQGGLGGFGSMDCAYSTWEQCLASASGTGRHCTENPNYNPRAHGDVVGQSHRKHRTHSDH
jgi:Protein of unknown function (DUF3551)